MLNKWKSSQRYRKFTDAKQHSIATRFTRLHLLYITVGNLNFPSRENSQIILIFKNSSYPTWNMCWTKPFQAHPEALHVNMPQSAHVSRPKNIQRKPTLELFSQRNIVKSPLQLERTSNHILKVRTNKYTNNMRSVPQSTEMVNILHVS